MNVLLFVIYISYSYHFCDYTPHIFVKQMYQIGNMKGIFLVENYTCTVA